MKASSISFAIRDKQAKQQLERLKSKIRLHQLLMSTGNSENIHSWLVGMQSVTTTRKAFGSFFKKLNIILAVIKLQFYPTLVKTSVHTKVYACNALLSLKTGATRTYVIGEWINKLWHIHIMKYSSVLQINSPFPDNTGEF